MATSDQLFWGAGSSCLSSDGAAPRSNWSGGDLTIGRTAHDLYLDPGLYAELGIVDVRIDLDWARVEPHAGRADDRWLERLDERLHELHEAGLRLWLSLHQQSLPGWFAEDTDGFAAPGRPSIHWSRHVDSMAERFDHLAFAWIPVVDPIGWAVRTAHLGMYPPRRRSALDTGRVRDHIVGALDVTAEAHRLLRSGSATVIGAFSAPSFRGPGGHTDMWEQVFIRSWTRAIGEGVLEWPWAAGVERRDLADAFDAIALVTEAPFRVDETGALHRSLDAGRRDADGACHDETRLDVALHAIHEALPHDLLVMNVGVDTDDDSWREACFERWFGQILECRGDGVPISGVFVEPMLDGALKPDGTPEPSFRWVEAQR